LTKFVARYKGTKLERARDLFEQCLEAVGAKEDSAAFYKLYAKLEEEHGLLRHAMSIYDRATQSVPKELKVTMYKQYIKKAEQFFGVTKTREIYAKAVEDLSDHEAKDMCLQWASVERKLGEVDRARGLLAHASQFCDPRKHMAFWKRWHDFEVSERKRKCTVLYGTVLCCAVLCCAVLRCAVLYCTVLYCTILYWHAYHLLVW
jgi:pre-mRNA-splicing factor SYF1